MDGSIIWVEIFDSKIAGIVIDMVVTEERGPRLSRPMTLQQPVPLTLLGLVLERGKTFFCRLQKYVAMVNSGFDADELS